MPQVNAGSLEHLVDGIAVELVDDDGDVGGESGGELAEAREEVTLDGVRDEIVRDGAEKKSRGGDGEDCFGGR